MDNMEPSESSVLPPPDYPPPMYSSQPLPELGPPQPYAKAVSFPVYLPPAYSQHQRNNPAYFVTYINGQNVVLTTQPRQSIAPSTIHHNTYTGYSIFTMLCCCLPIGIGALVYSMKTKGAITRGDTRAAAKYSQTSLILNHTALAVGLSIMAAWIIIISKFLR